MTVSVVRMLPATDADADLWRLTREVADLLRGIPWVLIGGQMVAIIEAEHGAIVGRATRDVGALVDVRALSDATLEAARRLQDAGFVPERHEEHLTYRFVRDTDVVDVLVPDHVGQRADLRTVPPDTTLETLGGRQALNRRRTLIADAGHGPFELPIPSLASAIITKARAASRPAPQRPRAGRARSTNAILHGSSRSSVSPARCARSSRAESAATSACTRACSSSTTPRGRESPARRTAYSRSRSSPRSSIALAGARVVAQPLAVGAAAVGAARPGPAQPGRGSAWARRTRLISVTDHERRGHARPVA